MTQSNRLEIKLREQTLTSLEVLVLSNKERFIEDEATTDDLYNFLWNSVPINEYVRKMLEIKPPGMDRKDLRNEISDLINNCMYSRLEIESDSLVGESEGQFSYVEVIVDIRKSE